MSHLSTDRLAALGDEEPTPLESEHLATCVQCARERAAYRTLVAMARTERDAIGIPLTRWDSIAGALAAESSVVVDMPTKELAARGRSHRFRRAPLRAAAGLLLFAGGAAAGRLSAGPYVVASRQGDAVTASAATSRTSDIARLTSDTTTFTSIDEAKVAQARSEAVYQQAAAYLAENDTSGASEGSPVVVKSRLAAIDQTIPVMREAMRQAPHDPVINGYYLTTLGQREATLRQLNKVLPASLGSNSF